MRAVGIVRQSKGRDDALSPAEQRDRISEHCNREGLKLIGIHEEIDVSGGTPLAQREGLSAAVGAVEAGEADAVLVAYFDRLVRSLSVQDEVVSRVEAAGGRVVAVDFGQITGATAAQWLSGTMIGAVSEYYRRSVKERAGEAQAMAVARGVVPWPRIPPGYERGPDGILTRSDEAPVVAEAFELRAKSRTLAEVRQFLHTHGISRSYHGVQSLLGSRVYLGEIHFGELRNTAAHEPIVSLDLWKRVQAMKNQRGARSRSNRLLARLGVLRCGSCGARMVVGSSHFGRYPIYRCPPVGDCRRRLTISAEIAEAFAIGLVKEALAGMEGRASADREARDAATALDRAQGDLDAALRAFEGLAEEPAAIDRLRELRASRDGALGRVEHLRRLDVALTVSVADWDRLTLEAQRGLIRATVAEITVGPGRGVERLTAKLLI